MKQLLEEVLYALEFASDMTKPDGLAGCNCPVCNVMPKVVAQLKEFDDPAELRWYDSHGNAKDIHRFSGTIVESVNGNVPLGGSQVVYDCSEPIRMDWEKRNADAEIASHAKRLALELECLLLSTKDTAAVTKWWDTAHEALQAYHDACREVYK